jgi:hypothetical protein
MCHDSRPTPLANLATISQPNSVNTRLYLLTNRRCLFNDSSSRQHHYFPHGVLSCSGTEDEDTLHYPYTSRSKSAMSYPLCYPSIFLFLSRCFFLLCFALLLLGYPNAQNLCFLLSAPCWGSMMGGRFYVLGTYRIPNDTSMQVETVAMVVVVVFILPFPASGTDR